MPAGDIFTCALFSFFLLLVLAGTSYDVYRIYLLSYKTAPDNDEQSPAPCSSSEPICRSSSNLVTKAKRTSPAAKSFEKVILAFSALTNGRRLLNTKSGGDTMSSLHGIRFLTMTWVVLGHTYLYSTIRMPWTNTIDILKHMQGWSIQPIMNVLVSVDTFLCVGGLLVTYSLLKLLDKTGGRFGLKQAAPFYLHRYLRLTPVYAFIMAACAVFPKYFGFGPLFHSSLEPLIGSCRSYWWRNLLYIQNFFVRREMCIGHSWYLALDMQLFIVSPLVIVPLHRWKTLGKMWLLVLTVVSVIIPAVLTYCYDLPPTDLLFNQKYGNSVQIEKFMNIFYIKPYCRASPYLVGIAFGYWLYTARENTAKLSKMVYIGGWLSAAATALAVMYGLQEYNTPYATVPAYVSVLYGSLHRLAWGFAMGWVIFACTMGYGGFVNSFLSWKAFMPLGRLAYTSYLISLPIQAWFIANWKSVSTGDHIFYIYLLFGHLCFTLAFSVVFTLLFESPIMTLEKMLLSSLTGPLSAGTEQSSRNNKMDSSLTQGLQNVGRVAGSPGIQNILRAKLNGTEQDVKLNTGNPNLIKVLPPVPTTSI